MHERALNLVLLLVLLPLVLFLIPLATGRIAPNNTYGYRTPASLSSETAWYKANRIAGRAGMVVCLANVALDLLMLTGALALSEFVRVLFLVASFGALFLYVEARLRWSK
jgi:uncharacterized membrane protein